MHSLRNCKEIRSVTETEPMSKEALFTSTKGFLKTSQNKFVFLEKKRNPTVHTFIYRKEKRKESRGRKKVRKS